MSSRVPFFEHPSRPSMPFHGNPSSVLKFRFPAASLFLLVGPSGLEPPTLRLSGARSSQLSYGPIFPTRTTSVQEMTFPLANIPCAAFYVFGVRTDFGSRVHAVCCFLRLWRSYKSLRRSRPGLAQRFAFFASVQVITPFAPRLARGLWTLPFPRPSVRVTASRRCLVVDTPRPLRGRARPPKCFAFWWR